MQFLGASQKLGIDDIASESTPDLAHGFADRIEECSARILHQMPPRWAGLSLFLDDGRIELDSNTVERSILALALNRNYALFAGSDKGGDNWAVIANLIENCKISGITPPTPGWPGR